MQIITVSFPKKTVITVANTAKHVMSADLTQILLDLDAINGEVIGTTAAEKTDKIEATKLAIETAIETADVDVPALTPFADYADYVLKIGDKYKRPSDWLNMPVIDVSDEKLAALFAVFEYGGNDVAFRVAGSFIVDWGDGLVENFNSNQIAHHNYDYDNITLNGTLSALGYKQAMILLTPQSGQRITSFEIVRFTEDTILHPTYSMLEIHVGLPNITTFNTGYQADSNNFGFLKLLQSFEMKNRFQSLNQAYFLLSQSVSNVVIDASGWLTFAHAFRGNRSLRYIKITNSQNVANTESMFNLCVSLEHLELFDTSSVTMALAMFYGCSSLKSIPDFDTSSMTHMFYMFYDCVSLSWIPNMDVSSAIELSYMLFGCNSLVTMPVSAIRDDANIDGIFTNNYSLRHIETAVSRSINVANASMDYDNIEYLIGRLIPRAGQSLTITGNPGAAAIMAAITAGTIAVPVGWTVIN